MPSLRVSAPPSWPADWYTGDMAIEQALQQTPGVAPGTSAPWAVLGPNPFASTEASGQLAWWVRLAALPAPTCPLADVREPVELAAGTFGAPCLDARGIVDALIDPVTGQLLGFAYGEPPGGSPAP
ncbi:MAG TPA: hypothetical protein VMU14_13110 [Acidimicrobiales bacterium]|nr:hypothetical protein [Acidimicrobiales bacterium]